MITPTNRPVRVAGASGSVSDRRFALAALAANAPNEPVDVICCDYMSEGTMAPAAMRKTNDPDGTKRASFLLDPVGPAFEWTFLEAIRPALPDLAKHGIRVAVNAGGSDTKKCYETLVKMIHDKGLDIPVAWVEGDDVLSAVKEGLHSGRGSFHNFHTDRDMNSWRQEFGEPLAAQAYLGGLGIAEAFRQGAQVVVCGRVSDASPFIGSAYWWHGWSRDMLHQLANALIAGHLLECSTYITGGNYSGFKELEHAPGGWAELGFPIGEIGKDGTVVITKQKNTGGKVTVHTCSTQLLYEIQGPWYFNSDVTAVLDGIWFEQLGPDRVALRGVKALPPPPTTKVGITALGGYQAENVWFLTGLDIDAKTRMLDDQIRAALRPYSDKYTLLKFHVIGSPAPNADSQDAATVCLRIFAQARNVDDLAPKRFLRPVTDNIMQPYPGATYNMDIRQGLPKPFYEYYVTLIPQSEVRHRVHFNGKTTPIEAPPKTESYPSRQPSQASTAAKADLNSFGPTQRLPLGTITLARAGDKGPDCNCGLWVRHADEYAWLRNLLSVENVKKMLGREFTHPGGGSGYAGVKQGWVKREEREVKIERFELPNLLGVHFLFRGLLDRGVTSTSAIDFLGKNMAEYLRWNQVDIPIKFLARGRL